MYNSLLEIVAGSDGNYYFSNFGEALIYALLGFVIVFVGIVLIILIIWFVGFLMRKTNNFAFLNKIKRKKKASEPVAEVSETNDGEIPDEIKAAIIAAIMAYYTKEQPKCEFKVKRIKRI